MSGSTGANGVVPPWLGAWHPPGPYDVEAGVFVGARVEAASFPGAGIALFADVDESSFWFEHRSGVIVDLVARYVLTGGNMLEVGSGSGAVAARLVAEGFGVMAVEPATGGAVLARRRGVDVSFDGTLDEARLPDETFDAVGIFDVIEHLDDWQPMLEEAGRVLRRDGHLLVTVPAHRWLWSEHDDWNEHKRRYSGALLRDHLRAGGFEAVEVRSFFAPLVLPALGRRLVGAVLRRSADRHEDRLRAQLAPPPIVNRGLAAVLGLERRLLRHVPMPLGTSLFAVARRAKVLQ